MRPFKPSPERLAKRVSEKGPAGKALAVLDECDKHMVALSVLAGEPKLKNKPLKDRYGKDRKNDKGTVMTEKVPVLDDNQQPVYEGSELSETEEILYRVVSSLLQIVRADRTYQS